MQEKQPSFLINPNIKVEIIPIGIEQTPVIIIDDLAIDNTDVINFACTASKFSNDQVTFYPGIRAPLPQPYVIAVLQAVYRGICQVYQIPLELNLEPLDQSYSLLTKQESELHFLQCMPHFDTSNPYHFAVLHYLNPGSHGNTGFFRHIPTGYERIGDSRSDHYINSAKAFIEENGQPLKNYVTRSDKHYELYYEVEYKPNRLVIYPGNILHSTIVNTETDIDSSPYTGRLTANMFIDFL
jgi:hypothetical protein